MGLWMGEFKVFDFFLILVSFPSYVDVGVAVLQREGERKKERGERHGERKVSKAKDIHVYLC